MIQLKIIGIFSVPFSALYFALRYAFAGAMGLPTGAFLSNINSVALSSAQSFTPSQIMFAEMLSIADLLMGMVGIVGLISLVMLILDLTGFTGPKYD
jgi:hypothetical protein